VSSEEWHDVGQGGPGQFVDEVGGVNGVEQIL
jgi:hypothetical protein